MTSPRSQRPLACRQLAFQTLLEEAFGATGHGDRLRVDRWEEVEDDRLVEGLDRIFSVVRRVRHVDGEWPGLWGEDRIAVVPEPWVGTNRHAIRNLFPDDFVVHDHTAHWLLDEHPALAEHVRWLPLQLLEPVGRSRR